MGFNVYFAAAILIFFGARMIFGRFTGHAFVNKPMRNYLLVGLMSRILVGIISSSHFN